MNRRRMILGMAAVAAVAATPAIAAFKQEVPFSEITKFWGMLRELGDKRYEIDATKSAVYNWLAERNATFPLTLKGPRPEGMSNPGEYAEVTFHRLALQNESHGHRVLSLEISSPQLPDEGLFLHTLAWGK